MDLVDLKEHDGGHPRKGVVDLIPIHPITDSTTLDDCGKVAMGIGEKLQESHPELSVFFFGHADLPLKRDLVKRRKEVGWFKNDKVLSSHGISGIGAMPYMSNFNVKIQCDDIKIGQNIAKSIRERSGGLLGVQSMAFPHGNNQIEIACNVDLISFDEKNPKHVDAKQKKTLVKVTRDYYKTPFNVIHREIVKKARESNCDVIGDSVIIGFTPYEACRLTKKAFEDGNPWLVGKLNRNIQM